MGGSRGDAPASPCRDPLPPPHPPKQQPRERSLPGKTFPVFHSGGERCSPSVGGKELPLCGGPHRRRVCVCPPVPAGGGSAVRGRARQGAAVGSGRAEQSPGVPCVCVPRLLKDPPTPPSRLRTAPPRPQPRALVSRRTEAEVAFACVPLLWPGREGGLRAPRVQGEKGVQLFEFKLVPAGREPGSGRVSCGVGPGGLTSAPRGGRALSPGSPVAPGHPRSPPKRQKTNQEASWTLRLPVSLSEPLVLCLPPSGTMLAEQTPALKASPRSRRPGGLFLRPPGDLGAEKGADPTPPSG